LEIYFTSDTHAFHKNICRGVTSWEPGESSIRDFDNEVIMTETLADRINSKVGANDVLIHCGDWSFGGANKIKIFREMLNCKKIYLLYGNHDHRIRQNYEDCHKLFYRVDHYMEREYNKVYFCMSHYPLGSWNGMGRGSVNLYGHCHGSYSRNIGRQMDVGVDTNGLYPYSLEEIIDKMLKIDPVLVDHHNERSNMR
jgi:calcineurin-like phosphoesterase family protein